MDNEEWKLICDFPDYMISNLGKVMRITKGHGTHIGKVLKPKKHTSGYSQVTLARNKIHHYRFTHRLVLEAFIGKCPTGYATNHINRVRTDNCLKNLEYLEISINSSSPGIRNGNVKLSENDVFQIRELANLGLQRSNIAKLFSITWANVNYIIKRKTWNHI